MTTVYHILQGESQRVLIKKLTSFITDKFGVDSVFVVAANKDKTHTGNHTCAPFKSLELCLRSEINIVILRESHLTRYSPLRNMFS